MKRIRSVVQAVVVQTVAVLGVAVLAGCDAQGPSLAPNPSLAPSAVAARPAVQIDQTWQAKNGQWTFTGLVDPHDGAADVVLEIGPGPAAARTFDRRIAVAQGVAIASPVKVTTRDIPDIEEICVRFTATNDGGTSSSSPLCFPHDLPSFVIGSAVP